MDYRTLHIKTVADLREIAKANGVKIPAGTNKAVMIEMILDRQAADAMRAAAEKQAPESVPEKSAEGKSPAAKKVSASETKPMAKKAPGRKKESDLDADSAPKKRAPARKAADQSPAASESKAAKLHADTAKPAPRRTTTKRTSAKKPIVDADAPKPAQAEGVNPVQPKPAIEPKTVQAESNQPVQPKSAIEPKPAQAESMQSVQPKPAIEPKPAQAESVNPVQPKPAIEPKPIQAESMQPVQPKPAIEPKPIQAESMQPVQSKPAIEPKPAQAEGVNPVQPKPTAGIEPKPAQTEGMSELKPTYHRPLSTQQRMGARTQPAQSAYRTQPGMQRPQNRFNTETQMQRPGAAPAYRRPIGDAAQSNVPRRAPSDAPFVPPANRPQTLPEPFGAPEAPVRDRRDEPAPGITDLIASGDCGEGAGILEIHPDGFGFLRAENYLPSSRDVYVSAAQIRRFNLRTGDHVVGKTRAQQFGDRSVGLIYIDEVNGQSPDSARSRRSFDTLIPVYPNERLRMECEGAKDISLRLVDIVAPIGKGQRGMIVSQPKAGKTTLLKKIANAITTNHPEVHLIVLLIDERPEEVTDMKRSINGEVVYSTFDEAPENHTRVSEMVLERAQRLVELGKDVVVLLDSITRLARAYNLVIPPTGRSLSGGLDPGALFRPKRFFGAARNIENGGSLTVIATALVDTGSRMDDIIFEEFKGTGNMELHLDRSLSDRRIFPALDLYKSGTRREELLLSGEELEGEYRARRVLSKGGSPQEATEQLISLLEKTKTNEEFFTKLKGWLNVCEKDGFGDR